MDVSNRYPNPVVRQFDKISYLLMCMWCTLFSLFVSCYVSTITDKHSPQNKLFEYFLCGPILGFLLLVTFPLGAIGVILWVFICTVCLQEKYTYVIYRRDNPALSDDCESEGSGRTHNVFTFASANVLLAPEFIARFNNNKYSFARANKIAKIFLRQCGKPLSNMMSIGGEEKIPTKEDCVLTEFPPIDFLCFQEVWERCYASCLIMWLKKEYPYFLCDVGEFKIKTNLCALGSGLMFASRKPILDADFKTFSCRTKHAAYVSLGILCVKVLLGSDCSGKKKVGYIANLHAQAFQGKDCVIANQLSETLQHVKNFQLRTLEKEDVVNFDVICGDFNADNMSPADFDIQHHPLFTEYTDVCVMKPGEDHNWAVGTELRQMMMFKKPVRTASSFQKVLIDDSLRRMFVLDADVLIHSEALMTAVVKPDCNGKIKRVPWGGRRRVDKILCRNSLKTEIMGYCAVTALTNLTDHLPVCLTLKVNDS